MSKRTWELVLVVITAVITGLAVYFRTVAVEERKAVFEERKYAYAEFFEGTGYYWQADALMHEEARLRQEANAAGDQNLAAELIKQADQAHIAAKKALAEYRTLYSKARFKIAVFSDAEVVTALARYWELSRKHESSGRCGGSPEKWKKDIALYQALRAEFNTDGDVTDRDMAIVLFPCVLDDEVTAR